jgi:hypothetical protein
MLKMYQGGGLTHYFMFLNHEKHERTRRGLIARNPHGRDTDGTRTGHGRDTDGTRTGHGRDTDS